MILFEPCLDRDEAGQLAFVDALLRAVRGEDVAFGTADGHVAVLAEEVDGFPDLRVLSRRIHGELQASGRAPTGCWMSVCDARGRFISTVEVGPVAV